MCLGVVFWQYAIAHPNIGISSSYTENKQPRGSVDASTLYNNSTNDPLLEEDGYPNRNFNWYSAESIIWVTWIIISRVIEQLNLFVLCKWTSWLSLQRTNDSAVKWTIILPWPALPHCAASEQLRQTWACDCGSESLWVLEQCRASLALCIGGTSCAEGLLFCKTNTLNWADAHTLLSWLSFWLTIAAIKRCWKQNKQKKPPKNNKKPVHLPLKYSTSKVASACHENDPHSLLTYGLQGGSCILLDIWLILQEQNIKLESVNIQVTLRTVLCLLCLTLPCRTQR